MIWTASGPILRSTSARFAAAVCVAILAAVTGCPMDGPPDGNGNDNTPPDGMDDVSGEIVSFASNFGVSELDPPISVIYSVTGTPDSISGYYVRVADANPGASPIGDRVIIATNLLAGTNRFFNFDPALAGVGFFRVGIIMTAGTLVEAVESEGIVQVEGTPNPRFIRPIDAITEVTQGDAVIISFDAGDPEGDVHWRLFYLSSTDSRDTPPDQLGTELALGTGNVGNSTFPTAGLPPGDYELGVSATDSGSSIATTVANGETDRIVTIPNATTTGPIVRVTEDLQITPPTLTFTAPGSSDVELFRDEPFTLAFTATISESGARGEIELFYDSDSNFSNGFQDTIIDRLPHTATSFPLPIDLPEGTWHIGATIRTIGGVSAPVTVYASGRVIIVRDPTLTVTEPDSRISVAPSTFVPVSWSTNAPVSSGTVDVFAQSTEGGLGPEMSILSNAPTTTTSAFFSSNISGVFLISVRLEFIDGTTLTATAPERVRVSSLPPVLWLGSLADPDPSFEGAIFGGVNFEDNAGTTLTTAGDLNGDGTDELVVGARYGKPFFVNPSGIGPGEAYLIYGVPGSNKHMGEFSLNTVGTSFLPGVTLTGIRTADNSDDTDGLSDITSIPDADGDGNDELAFGFPRTNSASTFPLCGRGQFLNGGVVIVSSASAVLADPLSQSTVINLGSVGQIFTQMSLPFTEADILEDRQTFEEDDCAGGTDGLFDTIIGPCEGFFSTLAPPVWEQLGFTWVNSPPAPAEGLCETEVDLSDCPPGTPANLSGFYPVGATPLQPQGARILGRSPDDRFGTSVTASNALGDDGPGNLIISAPNRSAQAGEVSGISSDIVGSGVAFLFDNELLWPTGTGDGPGAPFQYIVGSVATFGGPLPPTPLTLHIAGDRNDNIQNIIGIKDFNGDRRNDFVVGAPNANGGQGRVYIAYRREEVIEGDFVLNKLQRAPNDPERLDGMLITADTIDGLGSSLAGGFDFNRDGYEDLVVGSPDASNRAGEIIVIFGNPRITSDLNGITVTELLSTRRTTDGAPVAVRITGNSRDATGQFGFNVANAGDVDGDGLDDLLIAAPGASPRFDPDPSDSVDELTDPGLDLDFDGEMDDVSGQDGRPPDGEFDVEDHLEKAGIVYLILGSNRLDLLPESETSDDITISIAKLGSPNLRGLMIVGWHEGDRIGGGDAGDTLAGGIIAKDGRGRSDGLASAGDVDGDGRADILIGSVLADPRRDLTGGGVENGGEAYLIYGSLIP